MGRLVLEKGKQKEFLNRIRKKSGLRWSVVADICKVSERTIRDWRREKFYMKHEAASNLAKESSIPLCKPKKILSDYWNLRNIASIGARGRYKIYGNPGTPEGRRKGGFNSQKKFRENPKYAEKLGVKIRKNIKKPMLSYNLAEFIGILLGDGGLTNYQTKITFNRETDRQYAIYMRKLIKELFNVSSVTQKNKNDKASNIVISSKSLVEFLLAKGLKIGHKINNQIDIPVWVKKKRQYKIACMRGLMDTDGSFYRYKHKIKSKTYSNFALCLTSYSTLLINSSYGILKELKLNPSKSDKHVYLHRKKDIELYMQMIGTRNPKHLKKYKSFIKERYGSGHNRTVSKTV